MLWQFGCPGYALSVLVGFDNMLRTGELMSLKTDHFICTTSTVHTYLGADTKTGWASQRHDAVEILDSNIRMLVRRFIKHFGKNVSLVANHNHFRQLVKLCFKRLGLEPRCYALYGIRRGGATCHFQASNSYDATMERGRWTCQKSMRTYITQSMKTLAEENYSKDTLIAIKLASKTSWKTFPR